MLIGFILKIPTAGVYILGILTPVLVATITALFIFIMINENLLPAMFVSSKKQSPKEIYTEMITIPFKQPLKIVFNMMLGTLLVAIPVIAIASILFGSAFAGLWTLWRFYGMGYVLALSIQGGSNFLALFIDLSYQLVFAAVATAIINSFSGIFFSIYKDAK